MVTYVWVAYKAKCLHTARLGISDLLYILLTRCIYMFCVVLWKCQLFFPYIALNAGPSGRAV